MKVLVAAVFVLCAVALCSCAQKKVYTPPTCCFTYASGKIPQGNVVNYFKTSSDCPKPGIIIAAQHMAACSGSTESTTGLPGESPKPALFKRREFQASCCHLGYEGFHRPTDCCMSYTPRNIRCVFMEDYIETSSACSRPAVIFVTKKGQRVCADPNNERVQKCKSDLRLGYNFLKDIFSKVKGH
ncbi:hypothetical protein MJG53_014823 [Ovis ammon polii x Ovis aries]|uniref:Uncharacterized protein n=1 Tax=Ovis ammon polii x Ovis aries TaxID=2918886 RepID=A0ACB9UDA8_9CETA|nr:hypothetical protein MJG53_014823 [Ovis ammon polii x Ovis aries]